MYLQLNYTGGVPHIKLQRVAASCQMDIYRYPFDIQNRSLAFHFYLHEGNTVDVFSIVYLYDLLLNIGVAVRTLDYLLEDCEFKSQHWQCWALEQGP